MAERTRAELVAALRRADAAGDVKAAAAIARKIKAMEAKPKQKPTSFWQGVQEGLVPASANAIRIAAGIPNPFNPAPFLANAVSGGGGVRNAGRYKRDKERQFRQSPNQGSTFGRITGAVLGTAPTMLLPAAGWLGALGQGAASSALLSDDISDPSKAIPDALLGAATGGLVKLGVDKVAAPVLRAAANSAPGKAAINAVTSRLPIKRAPARPRPMPPAPDPKVAERTARFNRVGVNNPTTAMVTRNPTAWTRERNLQQLTEGQPVKDAILSVQDDLYNAAQTITAGAPGREATGKTVKEIVEGRNKRLGEGVSMLYTRAREQYGDVAVPSLDNLWSTMADPAWRNNSKFGAMNSQITGMLKDFNVIDDAGANIPGASLNLSQANELRKFIGQLGDGNDPTIKAGRKLLINALDDDVLSNVGDDAFAAARKAARDRFAEFESGLTNKMASDGMFDEALPARIVQPGTSHQQVRDLFKTLGEEGEAGRQAIEGIRRQVLADMLNNPSAMMTDGTTTAINGKTLWNAFERNKDRYKVIFGDEMFPQVSDYITAVRDATVQPAMSSVNTSGTAAMLMNNAPDYTASMFAAPEKYQPGFAVRNAPAIGSFVGGGVGSLLGATSGPGLFAAAGGGAGVGAAAGRGIQALAEKRAQASLNDITRRQIDMAVDPALAAQEIGLLGERAFFEAGKQAQLEAYRKAMGLLVAPTTAGLLSF